jgi:hypothetical protein
METIYNVLFFTMMFLTRKVRDEFTINRELRTMNMLRFAFDTLFLATVIFFPTSRFTELGCPVYFQIGLCLSLLYDSSFRQIGRTFDPNPIVPFPMNEEVIS